MDYIIVVESVVKKFETENKESILKKKREYYDNNKEKLNKQTLELYHKK